MIWYPHLTVATVVQMDDKFLMVYEESDGFKVYNQPAGHLERDESLQAAAIRETLEETAWHVELTGFLGMSRYIAPSNQVTYMRASFVAKPLEEVHGRALDEGIIEARWMSLNEIRQQKAYLRSPLVLSDIEKTLNGDVYPLALAGE